MQDKPVLDYSKSKPRRRWNWWKLLVLLLAIGLLHHFWRASLPPPPPVGGGDNDEDDVKYSPTVPVSIAPVTVATLHGYLTAYGIVEPEPGVKEKPPASADVRVPIPSLVAEVNCIEGQRVEKGQPLFTLDSRFANAAIAAARLKVAAAKENADRFGKASTAPEQYRLRAQHDLNLAQAELDTATAQLSLLQFVAPLSGTVVLLQIRPGEITDAATSAVQIVDLDRLVIATSVPGFQLHDIQVGQEAEIGRQMKNSPSDASTTAPATQPVSSAARVTFIDPQVDPKTGMGSVDVSVPAALGLRLGDFVKVRIVSQEHRDCLTVPAMSLVRDADGQWGISLAVRDFQWAFRHVVKVGLTEDDRVEVESDGLKAGDSVVTTGANALPDKSRIEVAK